VAMNGLSFDSIAGKVTMGKDHQLVRPSYVGQVVEDGVPPVHHDTSAEVTSTGQGVEPGNRVRRLAVTLDEQAGQTTLRSHLLYKSVEDRDGHLNSGMEAGVRETDERLAAERKHMIEAAVVRTMKQRKQLSHQELVMEVVDQLKTRFPPEMKFIKTRIESLIEREYLERVEGSRETYRYLA